MAIAAAIRRRLNRRDRRRPASHVPVSGPPTEINRRTYGKSTVVTEDGCNLPTAENAVDPLVGVSQKSLAMTNRHFPNGVEVDDVCDIEVRHTAVVTLTKRVRDE